MGGLLRQDSAVAGVAIPSFWLGIMLIVIMLIVTQEYMGEPCATARLQTDLGRSGLQSLAAHMACSGDRIPDVCSYHRMTRSAMLEVLREDYIRTARAGMLESVIRTRHALLNAMLPVVTSSVSSSPSLSEGYGDRAGVQSERTWTAVCGFSGCPRHNLTQALVMLVVMVFVVVNGDRHHLRMVRSTHRYSWGIRHGSYTSRRSGADSGRSLRPPALRDHRLDGPTPTARDFGLLIVVTMIIF